MAAERNLSLRSETNIDASNSASTIQAAAQLLLEVHAGNAKAASCTLDSLPAEQGLLIAEQMQRINELTQQSRSIFDAKVPSIHIDYKKDEYGMKLAPKCVRMASSTEIEEARINTALLKIRPGVSDEFARRTRDAIEALPLDAKKALAGAGYTFVAAYSVKSAFPELKGHPRGYADPKATFDNCPAVTIHDKKTCVVAETALKADGSVDHSPTYGNGIRHEGAHALDYILGEESDSAEFRKAYEQDLAKILPQDRQSLSYFLQSGSAGRVETFAEVFATIYGGSQNSAIKTMMQRSFPHSADMIRERMRQAEISGLHSRRSVINTIASYLSLNWKS